MPYSIRAEDGTLIQNIDDGVDPEEALADFKKQSTPQEWGTTFLGSLKAVPKRLGRVAATLSRVSAEGELERLQHPSGAYAFRAPADIQARMDEEKAKRIEELQGRVSSAIGANAEIDKAIREDLPGQQTLSQKVVSTAIASAPSTLAGMGTAVATRNANLGWLVGGGMGGVQQGTETMEDVRQRGGSLAEQKRHGTVQGIIEAMFDKLPIEAVMKFGTPLLTRMLKTGVYEGGQEVLTEGAQAAYERATYRPDITAKEVGERLLIAGLSGGMTGSVISGGYHPIVRAQERAIEQKLQGLNDLKPAVDLAGQAEKTPNEETVTEAAPNAVLNTEAEQPQEEPYVSRKASQLTPDGLEFDAATGELKIANNPGILYTQLPIETRLQAIDALTSQIEYVRSQSPGFQATAEDKIAQRGKVQTLERQQQEMMQQVLEEFQQNESVRPEIYNWAMTRGIEVPETPNVVQPVEGLEGRSGVEQATMEALQSKQQDTNMFLEPSVEQLYGMSPLEGMVNVKNWEQSTKGLKQTIEAGNVFHLTSDGSSAYTNIPDFNFKAAPNSAAFVTDTPEEITSPEDMKRAQQMLQVGKEIVNTVLPGKKLVIYQNNYTRNHPSNFSHMWLYGDTVIVMLPKGPSLGQFAGLEFEKDTALRDFSYLLTTSHEIGHAVMGYEFMKADPVVQQKLWDEWAHILRTGSLVSPARNVLEPISNEDLHTYFPGLTRNDVVANLLTGRYEVKATWVASRVFGPQRYKQFVELNGLNDSIVELAESYKRYSVSANVNNWLAYALSFDEYLAEQTSKYFFTRGGVVKGTESFFKQTLHKLAQIFQQLKGIFSTYSYAPQANFAQWMDGFVAKSSLMRGVEAQQTDVEGYKDSLRKAGAPEALIQAIGMVGDQGFQVSVMQEVKALLSTDPATLQQREFEQAKALSRINLNLQDRQGLFRRVQMTDRKAIKKALYRYVDDGHKEIVDMLMALPEFNRQGPIDPDLLLKTVNSWINPYHVLLERRGSMGAVTVTTKGSKRVLFESFGDFSLDGETFILKSPKSGTTDLAEQTAVEMALDQALANAGVFSVVDAAGESKQIPMWAYAEAGPELMANAMWTGVQNLSNKLGITQGPVSSLPKDLVKYNRFLGIALSAFQLAKLNLHIPGVKEIRQALRNKMMYKAEWLRMADDVVEKWAYDMGKQDQDTLARLLYDEARAGDVAKGPIQRAAAWQSVKVSDPNKQGAYIFQPTQKARQMYKLSDKAWELYSEIRNSYAMVLDDMERVGMLEISRLYFNDPMIKTTVEEAVRNKIEPNQLRTMLEGFAQGASNTTLGPRIEQALGDLQDSFQEQREKPYTPYPRFGQWAVQVRDQQGGLVHFETFESESARDTGYRELEKIFPSHIVKPTYVEDLPYAMQGMPPALLNAIQQRLNLTPAQVEKYQEMLKDLTQAQSFIKRTKHRKGVAGYSEDAVRGYADYFRRYANYISRVKAGAEIKDGLDMLEIYAKQQPNETNARRLHEWFVDMDNYLKQPGNELAELKSAVALWHFAGNISSAALNATQVPLVTLPYLAERYGWVEANKALMKAYKDVGKSWIDPTSLSAEKLALVNHGLDSGFLNQSFATTLAQMSDGQALTRISPVSRVQRATNKFAHYAMLPFAKIEEINRRVTLFASYDLSRTGQNMHNGFDQDAFEFARSAIEDTQNEYSVENRPRFMRGNMSVILQFMHYSQNMLFQMLKGDASWKKLLMTQLFIAGLLGMPLVSDALNLIKATARIFFGKDVDLERWAREYMEDTFLNADLVLKGLSSDVFGFDLQNRISLGDLVPGMQALGSHRKFQDAIYMATGDVGGPSIALMLGIMKGLADDDPSMLKRFEGVVPSAARYLIQAGRAVEAGGVEDRSGAMLAPADAFDVVGMSMGFKMKEVSTKYAARSAQQEAANYWTQRKEALMIMYQKAAKELDADAIQQISERIMDYNLEAPDPQLRITSKGLKRSLEQRQKSNVMKEEGYGTNPQMRTYSKQLSDLYHED